jgi:hypothetical protein
LSGIFIPSINGDGAIAHIVISVTLLILREARPPIARAPGIAANRRYAPAESCPHPASAPAPPLPASAQLNQTAGSAIAIDPRNRPDIRHKFACVLDVLLASAIGVSPGERLNTIGRPHLSMADRSAATSSQPNTETKDHPP